MNKREGSLGLYIAIVAIVFAVLVIHVFAKIDACQQIGIDTWYTCITLFGP